MTFVCSIAKKCGGCPGLVDGDYESFTMLKFRQLEEMVHELGIPVQPQMMFASRPVEYRRRIRVRCDNGRAMFFNPNKALSCTVLTPSLREILTHLFDLSLVQPRLFSGLTHLDVREADLDGLFGVSRFGISECSSDDFRKACPSTIVVSEEESVSPHQRLPLGRGLDHFVPIRSFVQINSEVNEAIQVYLEDLCETNALSSFWDLYCGVGNLSLRLAHAGLVGGGVDVNADAVRCAQASVSRWTESVHYHPADARQGLVSPQSTPEL
ncbi:MAG: hypothetical protein ACPGQS_08470, partial [Bradymonadia bacterium]